MHRIAGIPRNRFGGGGVQEIERCKDEPHTFAHSRGTDCQVASRFGYSGFQLKFRLEEQVECNHLIMLFRGSVIDT